MNQKLGRLSAAGHSVLSPPAMLHLNTLTYRVGGRLLLEDASVAVNQGERVGLIGRNGSGKTTILKLITGELTPDDGSVSMPSRLRVGWVAQDAPSGPESLLDTVLAADHERSRLLAEAQGEAEDEPDALRLAEIHERLAAIGADSAPARAARILAGLGFGEAAQDSSCANLSGGWRMRVALAALLFSEPELLLLDEPTNHLDLEATLWLEGYLKGYRGTMVLVSHDRDLLNRIPTAIIHLEGCKLTRYSGAYDRFERLRREQLAHREALRAKQDSERKHIQSFIDRFRYKASKARQAQSRIKALARMEPIASVMEARTVRFDLPAPKPLAPPMLNLEQVAVGYDPDLPVLQEIDLRLDMDDRVALLGANGNGKSTLVKLLAGRLQPTCGQLTRSAKLRVGYFAQDQAEALDLSVTPLTQLQRLWPKEREERARAHLGRFGFTRDQAETRTANLSGGEKARLLFALMSREAPQLLLLDEPTNHLDVDSRQALVQALNAYDGAVVLVSHDAHLIELVADRLWLVSEGRVRPFDGDLEDYRRLLKDQRRQERAAAKAKRQGSEPGPPVEKDRKARRRAAAEARAAVASQRKAVRTAEARVEALSKEKAALEARLADPTVYQQPASELQALQIRHGDLARSLTLAEEAWLEAQQGLGLDGDG